MQTPALGHKEQGMVTPSPPVGELLRAVREWWMAGEGR